MAVFVGPEVEPFARGEGLMRTTKNSGRKKMPEGKRGKTEERKKEIGKQEKPIYFLGPSVMASLQDCSFQSFSLIWRGEALAIYLRAGAHLFSTTTGIKGKLLYSPAGMCGCAAGWWSRARDDRSIPSERAQARLG